MNASDKLNNIFAYLKSIKEEEFICTHNLYNFFLACNCFQLHIQKIYDSAINICLDLYGIPKYWRTNTTKKDYLFRKEKYDLIVNYVKNKTGYYYFCINPKDTFKSIELIKNNNFIYSLESQYLSESEHTKPSQIKDSCEVC